MYRLIVILEWIFGAAFVFMFFALFVFHLSLFQGDRVVFLGITVALTMLFFIGTGVADGHVKLSAKDRANARKIRDVSLNQGGRSHGRDLILIGATVGVLGAFSLISGQRVFCQDGTRSYCQVLQAIAARLGMSDTDTAIAVVLVSIGAFFGLWGLWISRAWPTAGLAGTGGKRRSGNDRPGA